MLRTLCIAAFIAFAPAAHAASAEEMERQFAAQAMVSPRAPAVAFRQKVQGCDDERVLDANHRRLAGELRLRVLA